MKKPDSLLANGYAFHRIERGAGTSLLFIHGSVSDYRTWEPMLDEFAGQYRVIAYSRRYHWPNIAIADGADYSMNQQVDDLAAVIGELGISPAHIVGHSYGGFLALLLTALHPELVRSLTLVEPPVVPLFVSDPPKPSQIIGLLLTRPRTAAAIIKFGAFGLEPARKAFANGDNEKGLRIFGKTALGAENFERLDSGRLQQVRDNLIPAEFLGSGFASVSMELLRTITQPSLIVTGAKSPTLFHHLADRLEEGLQHVRRINIPGASHIVHEDSPAAFAEALQQFLAPGNASGSRP